MKKTEEEELFLSNSESYLYLISEIYDAMNEAQQVFLRRLSLIQGISSHVSASTTVV